MSAAIEIKAEELDEVLAYIDKFAGAMSGGTATQRRGYNTSPYPPAIAPMIKNGSEPLAIASGNGASGDSCDKSSPQARNRTIGRRSSVT